MESHLQSLVTYFSAHPHIALSAMFAAALLEALPIGVIIPGSAIAFAGGVLIGLKALDPWWTPAMAITGAMLGDGLSYWLGHHYHERIRVLWPLKHYPRLLDRGQAYFAKNGGKSVFLGRFLGPVRPMVSLVAGMSNMRASQFYAIDILTTLAWAAVIMVPGILFGASLQIAGAVSWRLIVMLVAIVTILWALSKLVRFVFSHNWQRIKALRDRAVDRARGKSGPLARLVLSLFDPTRAESSTLVTAAVLLIASSWLLLGVLQDLLSDHLGQFDQTVYTVLQPLRTRWADGVMVAVSELADAAVTVSVIGAVSLLLIFKRYWRTFGYWLATIGFAAVLASMLQYTLGRAHLNNIADGGAQFSLPSGHITLGIVMYGFMAFLLAREKSANKKTGITLMAAVAIVLIAFSRLYLGIHWFSDVLASVSLGLAWVALLSIAYTHHVRNEHLRLWPMLLVVLTTLILVGTPYVITRHSGDLAKYVYQPKIEVMLFDDWRAGSWRSLPLARSELEGDFEEPFAVQWAGTTEQIAKPLAAAGWQAPQPWELKTILLSLLPNTPIEQLPVLPKLDHGDAQDLTLVKVISAAERSVIRLWSSRFIVATGQGGQSRPLWYGLVTVERVRHPAGMITLTATDADFTRAARILEKDVEDHGLSIATRQSAMTVLLIW